MESILTSVKKNLGLDDTDTSFDADVILFINGTFSTLNQLGIGPEDGFSITDKTPTWDAFYGTNKKMNSVRTYVYLKVKMLFDPPQTSFLNEALNQQAKEFEWRLNALREDTEWTDPNPGPDDDITIDGGAP